MIINSAVYEGFSKDLTYINADGPVVFFGEIAEDMFVLNSRIIFCNQLQISRTTMGTNAEFRAMHQFIFDQEFY